jgi:hypothetical protein
MFDQLSTLFKRVSLGNFFLSPDQRYRKELTEDDDLGLLRKIRWFAGNITYDVSRGFGDGSHLTFFQKNLSFCLDELQSRLKNDPNETRLQLFSATINRISNFTSSDIYDMRIVARELSKDCFDHAYLSSVNPWAMFSSDHKMC